MRLAPIARLAPLAALALALLGTSPAVAGPQASCKTAYGKTACGYHCEAAYGEVACAQTPWGTCRAAYGKLVCGDGAPQLLQRPQPPRQATCDAAYGQVACGWGCTAAFGQLACAQTPEGRCTAAHGQVTCWDPPAPGAAQATAPGVAVAIVPGATPQPVVLVPVPGVNRQDPSSWPAATCETAYGQTACGYQCQAAYGMIACAQTPFGTCQAASGKVTCWDPPQ